MNHLSLFLKTSALAAVLSGAAVCSYAQSDYLPFVQEGKQWNFKTQDEIPFSYTIEGDTAISGKDYKKVYFNKEAEKAYRCAVREEDRLVYAVAEGHNEEEILCIFDLLEQKGNKYVQTFTGGGYRLYIMGRYYPVQASTGRIHRVYCSNTITTDGVISARGGNMWYEGVGEVMSDNIFPIEDPYPGDFLNCSVNGECFFTADDRLNEILDYYDKLCATPTIAYDRGRLVFGCETEGAECVYEIKCADNGSGRGGEVSLSQTYEICVYATLDGHYDSDVATATISWRDGQPVMEGFSSIAMDGTDERGDVNYDGKIDVADIAKILSMMAGTSAKQAP